MKGLNTSMTLKLKLIAGLLGILVLFLGVALFNLRQVHQIKTELERQNQKVELKLMALELKEMVQELNIIASGLEISKNADYIPKYNEKRKVYDSMIKRIGETADTDEKVVWRSKLILLTGEYTNTFDVAARLIQEKKLVSSDLDKNMEYLYNESQKLMGEIFKYVDQFYVSYSQDAAAAVLMTQSRLNSTVNLMIIALFIVALCMAAIGFVLLRSFMGPIQRLQHAVKLIAGGDLRHKINNPAKDELGLLSQSFDHMIDQVRSMVQHTQTIASLLSGHSQSFRQFSGATAASNKDILRAIQEISAGAEQQANHSERSSAIISDLAEQIQHIADSANTVLHKSREASFATHTGSKSMEALRSAVNHSEDVLHQVYLAMETLLKSSVQIEKIVGTITDISSQTNVLALNATIEAARAGAHGRGFSVIAEEVRILSVQTNESSRGIGDIVRSLQSQMKGLESSLGAAKHSFGEQNQKMNESLDSFGEIRESMVKLSEQIDQVHLSIEQAHEKNTKLVESVQYVAAIAEETAAGVEEVNCSSQQQDVAIQRIAAQSDDISGFSRQLFEEISKFRIAEGDLSEDERPKVAAESGLADPSTEEQPRSAPLPAGQDEKTLLPV